MKYTKNSRGYYHTRVWTGEYKDGKKKYKEITSKKSSRDLELKVSEYKESLRNGSNLRVSTMSLYEYALYWVDTYKTDVRPNTRQMYLNSINRYLPAAKMTPVSEMSQPKVAMILQQADGRSHQILLMMLKQIIRTAQHEQIVSQGDMFYALKSAYRAPEKRILTEDEIARLPLIQNEKARVFANLLYYTGMRREEALALDADDVTDVIRVNKVITFGNDSNYRLEYSTKSARGERSIPVSDKLRDILTPYIKDKHILFEKQSGGYMTLTAYKKMWKHVQTDLQSDVTAHIFRHNFCTRLCYDGTLSVKKIAELMGDTEAVVNKVYSHIMQEKEDTKNALNAL